MFKLPWTAPEAPTIHDLRREAEANQEVYPELVGQLKAVLGDKWRIEFANDAGDIICVSKVRCNGSWNEFSVSEKSADGKRRSEFGFLPGGQLIRSRDNMRGLKFSPSIRDVAQIVGQITECDPI